MFRQAYGGRNHGRLLFKLSDDADNLQLMRFITAGPPGGIREVSFGVSGGTASTYVGLIPDITNAHSDIQCQKNSNVSLPRNEWMCLEWSFPDWRIRLNGQSIDDLYISPNDQCGTEQRVRYLGVTEGLQLGAMSLENTSIGSVIFDRLELDDQAIGCPSGLKAF